MKPLQRERYREPGREDHRGDIRGLEEGGQPASVIVSD
ncbi:hypothetical protein ABIE53_002586 [Burkholderia sp. OAS925]